MVNFEPSVTLSSGQKMPMIGLGTWQAEPNEVKDAVEYAIDVGYRHFDTAYLYENEREVGKAVQKKIDEGIIRREDVFLTTKLWNVFHHPDHVIEGVRKSLDNLKLDYIDLFLIHSPTSFKYIDERTNFPKEANGKIAYDNVEFADLWKELEKAVDERLVKAIGVSNFSSKQIQHILDHSRIKPSNLQVKCHAYFMQKPLYDFCQKNNITFTAYAPLGSPTRQGIKPDEPILLEEQTLKDIAQRVKKTPAQILNRYLIERGRATIPKSVHRDRIKENFDIFNFEFTDEELKQLDVLDESIRYFRFNPVLDSPNYPFNEPF